MRGKFYIALILLLAACRPLGTWYAEPEGPPEYKLGWEDGCDTGLSAEDKGYIYRAVYGYKKRPELMENPLYKDGWNDGFNYCRYTQAAQQPK